MSDDDKDETRAELVARLEIALADVRAGRTVGAACVTIGADGKQDAWWANADQCVHAGAALRAAAAYLALRMDHAALAHVLGQERETNPRFS